jgi:Fe-S cluster biogenesis protein NfuA
MDNNVASVLDEMRPMLVADGADLELVGVSEGIATIRLVLGPDACAECIVPRPMFETILTSRISERIADITAVHLIDPRETQPAAPH